MTAPKTETFEREALPHLEAVYRFALRLTGSPGAAEDLVQETFLRAYRAWDQYTLGTNAKSWLFTICRNAFLRGRERDTRRDELVTRAARTESDADDRVYESPIFTGRADYDPEGDFFRGLVDDEILEAIDALPDEFREAVVLSDLQGMSYQEVSEILDVPLGTVKSRLFRGRKMLQKALYEYAVESGFLTEGKR
ncbi:MAG: sigma-70 family RNA polymerase sigma factor [Longimicrobiales bacterium]|nr:sigma-70 family RNA polymerase sigma factor [Longimicrobiales bacterium]